MRCNKCGYVSFDYLSECKKCGVDLRAIRDGLGYPDISTAVPFFLGALVSATESRQPLAQQEGPGTEPLEFDIPEIHFEDDLSFDHAPEGGDLGMDAAAPVAGQEKMRGQLDSALKIIKDIERDPTIELSDEELDRLSHHAETAGGLEFELNFDTNPPAAPARAPAAAPVQAPARAQSGPAAAAKGDMQEAQGLDFSDEELERLIEDTDVGRQLGLETEFLDGEEHHAEAPQEHVPIHEDHTESDLPLNLSDDELEHLLLELEDGPATSPDAAAPGKAAAPSKAKGENS